MLFKDWDCYFTDKLLTEDKFEFDLPLTDVFDVSWTMLFDFLLKLFVAGYEYVFWFPIKLFTLNCWFWFVWALFVEANVLVCLPKLTLISPLTSWVTNDNNTACF